MMTQSATDAHWMQVALTQATAAAGRGDVPVGAVLVSQETGEMLAAAGNEIVALKDPTAHAEILVIRRAAEKLGNERLVGATLFVTLEPCAMCAGAIAMARIPRLVFAATDPKGGAVLHGPRFFGQPTCHHHPVVDTLDGEQAETASALLKGFFRARR
jgi:tRNA(Arg) A34 adenosine deaminase TadA